MEHPDYHGGSIVNLMRSIERALDARRCDAAAASPELTALPAEALSGARGVFTAEPMFDRLAAKNYVVSPDKIIDSDYNVAHCGVAERRPYKELPELFVKLAEIIRSGSERQYWILGEQRYLTLGVHGGVSAAEMYVPLIVAAA